MRIPVNNLYEVGMQADPSPNELPLNGLTLVSNMRVQDGGIESIAGYAPPFTAPTVNPSFLQPVAGADTYAWLYGGKSTVDQLFAYMSGAHTDVTRLAGSYAGSDWRTTILNGVVVLTNNLDVPQMWSPVLGRAQDLTAWPTGLSAMTIRSYKNFLLAFGLADLADHPYTLRWSHPADPGTVPASWDVSDPNTDAGEVSLADTGGAIIDSMPLRNANVIYKEDALYLMNYIGGTSVFDFKKVSSEVGVIAPNLVAQFDYKGSQHIVLTASDLILFDGQNVVSLLSKRMRRWLFSLISEASIGKSRIVVNQLRSEVWVAFCTGATAYCDKALIWNWLDNTFTVRDLPNIRAITSGVVLDPSLTGVAQWDTVVETWATANSVWGSRTFRQGALQILGSPGAVPEWHLFDYGTTANGSEITSRAERTGLTVYGQNWRGELMQDVEVQKLLTEVWPRIEASAGLTVNVYVGAQMRRSDPVTWAGPYPFNPATDKKVNCLVSGKLLSVAFEAPATTGWKLFGYDLEIRPVGRGL